MTAFDTVVIVDWSGGNDRGPKPKRDAIWTGLKRGPGPVETEYHRNRQVAEAWLDALFTAEARQGRRVFAGFDFPFGYPQGFAQAVTGAANPLTLWHWIDTHLADAPKSNSRFDLAGALNRTLPGDGPFWGNGLARDIPDLPRKKPKSIAFPEWRSAERQAKGAFSCWQLSGAGSVGGQILTGLPVLSRLRARHGARAWPFEPLDSGIALVEVWPSLLRRAVAADPAPIRDEAQVRLLAQAIAALPPQALNAMLTVTAPEEGWIFALGHETTLQQALDQSLTSRRRLF